MLTKKEKRIVRMSLKDTLYLHRRRLVYLLQRSLSGEIVEIKVNKYEKKIAEIEKIIDKLKAEG